LARIARPNGQAPVLDLCLFQPLDDDEAYARILSSWNKAHGLRGDQLVTLMPSGAYDLLLVEAPSVPAEEAREAIRWRIKDLIDFPATEAVVDWVELPAPAASGRAAMIYAVVARGAAVKQEAQQLLRAGLRVDVVDIPELAQRNLATCLPEDAAGVALLRLEEDSGLITLTRQATLYLARRLDFGLSAVASSVSSEVGPVQIPDAVQSWLDRLVVEVQRSLDYYESQFSQGAITSLIVAPVEVRIKGMLDYLAQQLGMVVKPLDLNQALDCRESLDEGVQSRCFSVIGAALREV
jgi:MSHA biogenesis protein MshI